MANDTDVIIKSVSKESAQSLSFLNNATSQYFDTDTLMGSRLLLVSLDLTGTGSFALYGSYDGVAYTYIGLVTKVSPANVLLSSDIYKKYRVDYTKGTETDTRVLEVMSVPQISDSASLETISSYLSAILARTPTFGQKTMANSSPVVMASDYPYPGLPFGADYVVQTNPDAAGNYQTVTYKSGGASGTTVKTVAITFDASGNVLTCTM